MAPQWLSVCHLRLYTEAGPQSRSPASFFFYSGPEVHNARARMTPINPATITRVHKIPFIDGGFGS